MATKQRLPMFLECDKDKVFCRVREIKEGLAFKALARSGRLYSLSGAFLMPVSRYLSIRIIRDVLKRGRLFIWTGDRHGD